MMPRNWFCASKRKQSDGVRVAKIYTFKRGSYLIGLKHEIENAGKKELVAHAYYQLQRDVKAPDGESSMVSTFTGPAVFTDQEKFQKVSFERYRGLESPSSRRRPTTAGSR